MTTVELQLQRGVVVRTVYAVNNFDRELMMQLVEPLQEGAKPREKPQQREKKRETTCLRRGGGQDPG